MAVDRTVATSAARRRDWAWIVVSAVLTVALAAVGLYAFLLNVDLADAQRKLSSEIEAHEQTTKYLAETRTQLTARVREIEQLKAQLDYAARDYDQIASKKPVLPIALHFRSSWLGRGLVAQIQNTSERYLSLVMVVRNPTLAKSKRFTLEVEPEDSVSFGHLEGWQFASGDELSLFNDSFAPFRVVVP